MREASRHLPALRKLVADKYPKNSFNEFSVNVDFTKEQSLLDVTLLSKRELVSH